MENIYLASAAFQDEAYDLRKTVEAAIQFHFAGVQLWLSREFLERKSYLLQVRDLARSGRLAIMLHLPDDFDETFFEPASTLLHFQKWKKVVVHFFPGMQLFSWPDIQIGLENAFSGYDESYYWELFRVVSEQKAFVAFDLPRLFAIPPDREEETIRFARRVLKKMSENDVLHLIDFEGYHSSRHHWRVFGEGSIAQFRPQIRAFPGAVVLEYENLELAVRSREVLAALSASAENHGLARG